MKAVPGTLQRGGAVFAPTRWSVVTLATRPSGLPEAQEALTEFCQGYWPPLYAFLRRRGYSPSDAQDLTQGFFAHLLAQNTLARADRARGRLRTFLLGALEHFLGDVADRLQALKRGGGRQFVPLHEHLAQAEALASVPGDVDATSHYDRIWAASLVHRAHRRLRESFIEENKLPLFSALEPLVFGGSKPPEEQAEIAERLDMPLSTLRTSLHRLRRRYREVLRVEVADTLSDPTEVDDEMRYLYQVLLA